MKTIEAGFDKDDLELDDSCDKRATVERYAEQCVEAIRAEFPGASVTVAWDPGASTTVDNDPDCEDAETVERILQEVFDRGDFYVDAAAE